MSPMKNDYMSYLSPAEVVELYKHLYVASVSHSVLLQINHGTVFMYKYIPASALDIDFSIIIFQFLLVLPLYSPCPFHCAPRN